ncbi:GH1 family beta-glucosidase [Algirhabdus cladophorae]|uniref:GH1 family beta-glucosidase n=1 Tax=Algirhabdus cladophorae TaxID=3377108 RepID=UPI003B848BFE
MLFHRSDFPQDFLFGAATSSYQIEGHAHGGAGRTHWDDFAATPGNVVRAEHGQIACDHYNRFPQDLDLVANAGLGAYRFSTSWARVMPDGKTVNPEGLDFYDRLTDAILERGIKPAATLYHWELPSALADRGGWRNRDIANWFADFTHTIMDRIGDRMWSVAPINEPWCVAWLSHFEGHHAPGLRDIRATARAMHHVLLAQGRSLEVMRQMGLKNLGALCNMEWSEPASNSPEDIAAAARYDAIYNHFYISGLTKGQYPDLILQGLEQHLPDGWHDDFGTIQQPIDWFGINYYTRKLVAAGDGPWPSLRDVTGPLPKTQMDWEIYPQGLHDFILRTHREYTGNIPIYITENGMANPDPLGTPDQPRIDYLQSHIAATKAAMDAGAPVKGTFIWSLLDNYEWALGYEKRFGLVHVDFDTQVRTPKASYDALKASLVG